MSFFSSDNPSINNRFLFVQWKVISLIVSYTDIYWGAFWPTFDASRRLFSCLIGAKSLAFKNSEYVRNCQKRNSRQIDTHLLLLCGMAIGSGGFWGRIFLDWSFCPWTVVFQKWSSNGVIQPKVKTRNPWLKKWLFFPMLQYFKRMKL